MIDSYSRPLHHLRLRPRRAPGRARPARRRRRVRGDRRNPDNREIARALGVRYIESEAADDEVLKSGGHRARPGRDRVRRLRRGEHLHRADRARAAPRHPDHRARLGGGLREEAAARGRRPGDLAVQDLRRRDGARRAASPGRRRRSSSPTTGWRRSRSRPAVRGRRARRSTSARRVDDRRAAPARRAPRGRSPPRTR